MSLVANLISQIVLNTKGLFALFLKDLKSFFKFDNKNFVRWNTLEITFKFSKIHLKHFFFNFFIYIFPYKFKSAKKTIQTNPKKVRRIYTEIIHYYWNTRVGQVGNLGSEMMIDEVVVIEAEWSQKWVEVVLVVVW